MLTRYDMPHVERNTELDIRVMAHLGNPNEGRHAMHALMNEAIRLGLPEMSADILTSGQLVYYIAYRLKWIEPLPPESVLFRE